MWDLNTLNQINAEARNTQSGTYVIRSEEDATLDAIAENGQIHHCTQFDLDREDRIETLFIDTSGFGQANEPALSHPQFEQALKDLFREHGPIEIGITEQGQFQAYLGVWPVLEGDLIETQRENARLASKIEALEVRLDDELCYKADAENALEEQTTALRTYIAEVTDVVGDLLELTEELVTGNVPAYKNPDTCLRHIRSQLGAIDEPEV